jgi:hypothetical protein
MLINFPFAFSFHLWVTWESLQVKESSEILQVEPRNHQEAFKEILFQCLPSSGPYVVSKDDMGFGWPTRYLVLDVNKVEGGAKSWDGKSEVFLVFQGNSGACLKLQRFSYVSSDAVDKASNEYCKRMHNLFWDNCHSHCG